MISSIELHKIRPGVQKYVIGQIYEQYIFLSFVWPFINKRCLQKIYNLLTLFQVEVPIILNHLSYNVKEKAQDILRIRNLTQTLVREPIEANFCFLQNFLLIIYEN